MTDESKTEVVIVTGLSGAGIVVCAIAEAAAIATKIVVKYFSVFFIFVSSERSLIWISSQKCPI